MPLISEIQPNPPGGDPAQVQVEISGTPGATYTGFLMSIESDAGASAGVVDSAQAISGTFDANGIFTVTINDLENPSFTLVLSDTEVSVGTDLDADNDGTLDASAAAQFGTIEDAVGIPDTNGEPLYGSQLGGLDLPNVGSEPSLIYRANSTGDWLIVASNQSDVYDQSGTLLVGNTDVGTTFGTINPCFMPGTLIMTANGKVAVEDLKEDDLIVTAEGKTTPVKWLGYRSVQVDESYDKPICIAAGAVAEGIPNRDLFVSPNHAVHIEGLLINAGALVNGTTITEVEMSEDFKYYHVELAQHELILSEGMATESYLPQHEDRMDFDNGHEVDGEAEIMLFPLPYPRIAASYNVPAEIKEKLGQAGMRKTA